MPLLYKPALLAKGKTSTVILVALIALGLGAGAGYIMFKNKQAQQTEIKPTSTIKSTSLVGSKRAEFKMKNMDNEMHSITEWDGKVLIINFWATWCPPCVREIPAFIELHEKYHDKGFSMIGVAVDNQQAAIDFVDPMGINYPIFIGETEGIALNHAYGNRLGVLPYTVIVDKEGIIRHVFAREVTLDEMEKLIQPLL